MLAERASTLGELLIFGDALTGLIAVIQGEWKNELLHFGWNRGATRGSCCPKCGTAVQRIQPKRGKAWKIIIVCVLVLIGVAFRSSLSRNPERKPPDDSHAINAREFRCPPAGYAK